MFAAVVILSLAGTVHAACISNYQPQGFSQITSYNVDGSRNITVYMWDNDALNTGGIARYNTKGQVLEVTSQPFMNFTIKGTGQYVVFKNMGQGGCFAGNWVRGFNY